MRKTFKKSPCEFCNSVNFEISATLISCCGCGVTYGRCNGLWRIDHDTVSVDQLRWLIPRLRVGEPPNNDLQALQFLLTQLNHQGRSEKQIENFVLGVEPSLGQRGWWELLELCRLSVQR